MTSSIRAIIADDHTVLRVGLRAFLAEQKDPVIEVIADCASAEEAVELATEHVPDLLLLDLSMPGLGGLGGVLEIRRRALNIKILILSQYAEPESVRRALEAGANGYIVKTARGEELVSAIRAVMLGGTYVDPTLAGALIRPIHDENMPPDSADEALARLTARERQVLRLIAEGYSNKEIAQSLDIAVKTAMAHRANLMEKLNIHNRSMLIRFAIRMGVTTEE